MFARPPLPPSSESNSSNSLNSSSSLSSNAPSASPANPLEERAARLPLPPHLLSSSERHARPAFNLTPEVAEHLRIGIVQARFNDDITNELKNACLQELLAHGVLEANITLLEVPGALEIPLALQTLAQRDEPHPFHALVALGCVIRGETYHFELVSQDSSRGVSQVALDFHIPIANAILTTENVEQALARQSVKGREAAWVALEMVQLLETWA
jgi:6,7-dimethyl-8-ribityllumazine synthase